VSVPQRYLDCPGEMVELDGVGVTVDGSTILSGVTLTIDVREHLAVLGPNGSGKTTLLRVLSSYRYPTPSSSTTGRLTRASSRRRRR
jgi:ABC-type molybdenum transport system ATPase subunit/photorepair protein PhrA